MRSFAELAATLTRRNDRLRGLTWSASVLAVGACCLFLTESASILLQRVLPGWALPVVLVAFLLAATVAFAWGRRIPSSVARLLFEVDVRLGLDARLSSLHEIDSRGGPPALSERLLRDLRRRPPDWSRALPIPGRLRFLAVAILVLSTCIVLLLFLTPAVDRPAGERTRPADAASQAAPAGADDVVADNPAASPEEEGRGTSGAPVTTSTGGTQRSLSQILAELRPALSSAAANATASTSEDAAAVLNQELQKLEDRLATNSQPLSPEEEDTLRQAAAAAPDLAKAVDDATASSDLNALRETISQILSASSPPAAAAGTQATRTDVRPTTPSGAQSGTQPNASPSATPPDASSTGASNATEGASTAGAPPPDDSLFESGVGNVAPVAAPLALGEAGEVSSYVTQGVPVERATDASGSERAWTLDPDQVSSVLSARNLPAGAADIIRDYFQRITEANP